MNMYVNQYSNIVVVQHENIVLLIVCVVTGTHITKMVVKIIGLLEKRKFLHTDSLIPYI